MSNFNQVYVKGEVNRIVEDTSSIYLIGHDIIAQPVSLGNPYNRFINSTNGIFDSIDVDDYIRGHIIHDNYLYIWGTFTKVNGVNRYNLAKLNATTLELDLTFNPTNLYTSFDRPYLSAIVLNNYLYLGWDGGLVKIDSTDGSLVLTRYNLAMYTQHIATDGTHIFIGGWGTLRKIDPETLNNDTTFPNGIGLGQYDFIYALTVDSTGLYVAYSSDQTVKKLNKSTGATIWTVQLSSYIRRIKIDPTGNYLYVCGSFTTYNNQPAGGLIKLNASTGLNNDSFLQQFSLSSLKDSRSRVAINSSGEITDFCFDTNNNLYICGQFTDIIGGTSIYTTSHTTINFAKIDAIHGRPLTDFISTGTKSTEVPGIGLIDNNKIFIHGISVYGGKKARHIVKLLKETGLEDLTFNIDCKFTQVPGYTSEIGYYMTAIQYVAMNQESLYLFSRYLSEVNNVSVNQIVSINLTSGTVNTGFQPTVFIDSLDEMHADDKALYVANRPASSNSRRFDRLNLTTGALLADYSIQLTYTSISSIDSIGNDVYISGGITHFASSSSSISEVNHLVRFNSVTGERDTNFALDPSEGSIGYLHLTADYGYAKRSGNLIKFDLTDGTLDSTFQSPYSTSVSTTTILSDLQKNYLFVQNVTNNTIDILDSNTGDFTDHQFPQITFTTRAMLVSDGKLYTSGTGSSFYGDLTTYSTTTGLLAVSGPDDIILEPSEIPENSLENTQVGSISVYGGTAPFVFEYVSGNGDTDNSSFIIENNTIKLASGVNLNYELKNQYFIRLKVTDVENYVFEKSLTINITNVNEAPTDIVLSANSISENSSINTVIGTFTVVDPDFNPSTITVISGNDKFNISENTLRSSVIFDYENSSTELVTIRATDSDGLYLDKVFTIDILPVNEAPIDILLSSNTIHENSPVNTIIGTLTGTDFDLNDNLTFSVIVNTNNFNINGDQLRSSVVFNYENTTSQSVTIRATDSSGLYVDKQFTINILNVNEAPNSITLSNASILENNAIGDVIGTLSATDPENDLVTFSLDTVNDYASFSITDNQLKAATIFNRELKNLYTIRVIATDINNNTFSQTLNIIIDNRVEPPLNISLSSTQILENNLTDAIIGTLSAIDPEGGTISFSVVDGADKFNVVSVSGIWKLRASVSFDYATQVQHSVTVRATNANSEYADKTFSIEILEYIEPEIVNLTNQDYTLADSGKAYVETIYDPTVVGILINGAALIPGSVVINSNSGQKYLKLTGNITDYYAIPLNAKSEWVWSTSGYAIWQII